MEAETALQAPALGLPVQQQQLPGLQPARRASRSICSPPEGPFSYDSPDLLWEEGTYASTRFHCVSVPATRIQDFVLGENARGQTSFCVFKSERPWKPEQASHQPICAGPEDYSGRTPTGEPKGPGKRRSKIENGESVKRGCQAHFTIRVLAREQDVAEIRMYQSGHVNSSGETCHNASTMRKGVSHPRGKKAKTGQARYLEGEQEGMAVPQVPVMPLQLLATGMQGADAAGRLQGQLGAAAPQYQGDQQQQQPIDVMQHVAHMQALLAGANPAHLQVQETGLSRAYSQGSNQGADEQPPEGAALAQAAGVQAGAAMAYQNAPGAQLPAVAQLQLPHSLPDQAAPGQQALAPGAHTALQQHGSMAASAAAAPPGEAAPLAAASLQLITAKQNMLQAMNDASAMVQAICTQVPSDNDPRCIVAADIQRKANAELLRLFSRVS